jgi:hypothetical protein
MIPPGVEGPDTGRELLSIQPSAVLGLNEKLLSTGLALALDQPAIATAGKGPVGTCWELELGDTIEVMPATLGCIVMLGGSAPPRRTPDSIRFQDNCAC